MPSVDDDLHTNPGQKRQASGETSSRPRISGRSGRSENFIRGFSPARAITQMFDNVGGGEASRERKSAKHKDVEHMKGTFVDPDAMKEKVRQNLTKPQHSIRDYYHESGIFQAVAKSQSFEYVTLAIVAFNAIWIAIDTDLNSAELILDAHPIFQIVENFFCASFSLEWVVRFGAFKRKRNALKEPAFLFDSFLVLMMVLETWVMTVVLVMAGATGSPSGNASILRVARLLRLSRMARMARLLRALPELMIMIRGMMAATRSVFFTLCLLIIVLYVFAIAFAQMTANTAIGTKYFSTVPEAMFTLLVYGTLLDNVGVLARELGKDSLFLAGLFGLFVLIAALTLMNMLIGVLCEVVNAVAATEKEEMLVTYVHQKLQRVVSLLDTDGGGTISKREFTQILENSDAVRCLQDVGVDVVGLVDFADFIFEEPDIRLSEDGVEEHNEVELDFTKFMQVVLQLRGSNNATVKDIVDLRKFMRNAIMDINRAITKLGVASRQHATLIASSQHLKSPSNGAGARGSSTSQDGLQLKTLEQAATGSRGSYQGRNLENFPLLGGDAPDVENGTRHTLVVEPQGTWQPYLLVEEVAALPGPLPPSSDVDLLASPTFRLDAAVNGVDQKWTQLNNLAATPYPMALQGQWHPVEPEPMSLRPVPGNAPLNQPLLQPQSAGAGRGSSWRNPGPHQAPPVRGQAPGEAIRGPSGLTSGMLQPASRTRPLVNETARPPPESAPAWARGVSHGGYTANHLAGSGPR